MSKYAGSSGLRPSAGACRSCPHFTHYRACLEQSRPDLVILCPATAEHGLWTKRVAEYGVHIMVEKPFARPFSQSITALGASRS